MALNQKRTFVGPWRSASNVDAVKFAKSDIPVDNDPVVSLLFPDDNRIKVYL